MFEILCSVFCFGPLSLYSTCSTPPPLLSVVYYFSVGWLRRQFFLSLVTDAAAVVLARYTNYVNCSRWQLMYRTTESRISRFVFLLLRSFGSAVFFFPICFRI